MQSHLRTRMLVIVGVVVVAVWVVFTGAVLIVDLRMIGLMD